MDRLDKLIYLFECATQEKWSAALFSIAEECGFMRILFGIVPSKTTPLETAFLKSNYPQEWRYAYDEMCLHNVDPTVSHCLGSTTPIIWKPDTFKGKKQNEFYEQACGFGLRSGIT
ncbi:MAG: autoinducer binding domain-containing protein [Burkholderiales bacterium]